MAARFHRSLNLLGADAEKDEEFKKIPGGPLLTFPIEHAVEPGVHVLECFLLESCSSPE